MVRRHLPTGRAALYLGDTSSLEPVGLEAAAGRAWVDGLFKFATQPRFVYKHIWTAGEVCPQPNYCVRR
jgi:alpha-ketoglutarate-dependent taurine dioxygenase